MEDAFDVVDMIGITMRKSIKDKANNSIYCTPLCSNDCKLAQLLMYGTASRMSLAVFEITSIFISYIL